MMILECPACDGEGCVCVECHQPDWGCMCEEFWGQACYECDGTGDETTAPAGEEGGA